MKLYIYDHCPFCVKARMIIGFTGVPVEVVVLRNDDIDTPTRMIGQKMLPILESRGHYTPESMEIVRLLDSHGPMRLLSAHHNAKLSAWIDRASGSIYRLAIPRWAAASLGEFETDSARQYFVTAKEAMIGPFERHLARTPALLTEVNALLKELEPLIVAPYAVNGRLSEDDIHLFPMLRALSIAAGVRYPEGVDAYRRKMALQCKVPLHDEIAL